MKLINIIILLFAVTHLYSNSVKIDLKYLPNTTLSVKEHTEIESTINMVGDKSFNDFLLNVEGSKFPKQLKHISESKKLIKSRDLKNDGTLPLEKRYISSSAFIVDGNRKIKVSNSKDRLIDSTFYYSQLENGDLELKKVKSELLSDFEGKKVFTLYKDLEKNKQVNQKSLKVGESFTEKQPMTIPINDGIHLDLIQQTKYLLKKITKDGVAIFDLVATYVMKRDKVLQGANVVFTGQGRGEYHYDIKNRLDKNFKLVMNSDMSYQQEGIVFQIASKSTSIVSKTILE